MWFFFGIHPLIPNKNQNIEKTGTNPLGVVTQDKIPNEIEEDSRWKLNTNVSERSNYKRMWKVLESEGGNEEPNLELNMMKSSTDDK